MPRDGRPLPPRCATATGAAVVAATGGAAVATRSGQRAPGSARMRLAHSASAGGGGGERTPGLWGGVGGRRRHVCAMGHSGGGRPPTRLLMVVRVAVRAGGCGARARRYGRSDASSGASS
eukprot:ctg_3387.g423